MRVRVRVCSFACSVCAHVFISVLGVCVRMFVCVHTSFSVIPFNVYVVAYSRQTQ